MMFGWSTFSKMCTSSYGCGHTAGVRQSRRGGCNAAPQRTIKALPRLDPWFIANFFLSIILMAYLVPSSFLMATFTVANAPVPRVSFSS
jgi:hypothetical protein